MGGQEVWTAPGKSQNIGFLSNASPEPLKIQKATKPVLNVIRETPFKWRLTGGTMMADF